MNVKGGKKKFLFKFGDGCHFSKPQGRGVLFAQIKSNFTFCLPNPPQPPQEPAMQTSYL